MMAKINKYEAMWTLMRDVINAQMKRSKNPIEQVVQQLVLSQMDSVEAEINKLVAEQNSRPASPGGLS